MTAEQPTNKTRIDARRHPITGQFYAMSHQDRAAFDKNCKAIIDDINPLSARELWLANAIAEGKIEIMPDILVTGGGSSLDGLAATLMRVLADGKGKLPLPDKADGAAVIRS